VKIALELIDRESVVAGKGTVAAAAVCALSLLLTTVELGVDNLRCAFILGDLIDVVVGGFCNEDLV
jgi:hypothetical protein